MIKAFVDNAKKLDVNIDGIEAFFNNKPINTI